MVALTLDDYVTRGPGKLVAWDSSYEWWPAEAVLVETQAGRWWVWADDAVAPADRTASALAANLPTRPSFDYVVGNSTIAVPGTRVRRSETTVELPSGGVMMTAGLIQQVNRQAISGLPGLINLPILGALFRSRDYQRQETELMIMCTPFIARPMEQKQVSRPDDNFVDATDGQAVLLGQINRLYGRVGPAAAAAAPLGRTYRGRVGFIVE